jgi:hypothetical protein
LTENFDFPFCPTLPGYQTLLLKISYSSLDMPNVNPCLFRDVDLPQRG